MKGFNKLDYQGSITLDLEKLQKAQEYTTMLFALVDFSFSEHQLGLTLKKEGKI